MKTPAQWRSRGTMELWTIWKEHPQAKVRKIAIFAIANQNYFTMPVRKVEGGYRWGQHGKVYPTKEQAERQGRAAYAAGYREPKKK